MMKYSYGTTFVLNPAYNMREDSKRVILYNSSIDPGIRVDSDDILTFLHPLYAIVLAQFTGTKKLGDIIVELVRVLKLDESKATNLIEPLLSNEKELQFEYDGHNYFLPRHLLIEVEPGSFSRHFNIKDFMIPRQRLDFDSWRLFRPLDCIFMINTLCVTDCVYCFADRRERFNCRIPMGRLKEIIEEARIQGLRSFDLTGGEIFLYPDWCKLIQEIINNGFDPYISTKMPLNPDTINTLKEIGVKRIQISLDTIVPEELKNVLGVDDNYYHAFLKSIKDLNRLGINIYANSQITHYNQDNVTKLIDFLLSLENIKRINVGAAGFSLYRDKDYADYSISLERAQQIESYIDQLKTKTPEHIMLNFPGYTKSDEYQKDKENHSFAKRARCTGNFSSFFLLPDGKVTICEELYFHPAFIIGDLSEQSILEMWNSQKALDLYKLSKDKIQASSPCYTCDEFDDCHQKKGVCWKEVLYAYGDDNWDYPDPRCPKAPAIKRKFFLE
jgi:radical SAM protein with 4Fe4S-binding SPASM domain